MAVTSSGSVPDLLLKAIDIYKEFPGVIALDRVNFDVYPGEVHCLVGENGAGKSTLIEIISGQYKKDGGTIYFENREVEIPNPAFAQRLGIATLHQDLNLVPYLTAAENIFLGREPKGRVGFVDYASMRRKSAEILDSLGVSVDYKTPVGELGVAVQQLVAIAKALSLKSKMIVLDEPSAVLTEEELDKLFAVMSTLRKNGIGIVYISHRIDEIFRMGDRVTILKDGKKVGCFDPHEISKDDLIQMMLGKKLTMMFPEKEGSVVKEPAEALRAENLSRYPRFKNVSFSVRRGEILGIFGLVGAGKTEIARAIIGADGIDQGSISVNGEARNIASPKMALELGIGLVPEDRKLAGLIQKKPVAENICITQFKNLKKSLLLSYGKIASMAQGYIDRLNIKTASIWQNVENLSGGNQQKVVLAKWLAARCRILILDEPTRGIDVGAKTEVFNLMANLAKEGIAVVMISSEIEEILGMCDRILVMYDGEIRGEFSFEDATRENLLRCAMGG
jgi:ribose transport system ATP-binding protein